MPRGLTPRAFALDLKKFGEVTRKQATLIFRKIALDLDTRVVLDTPVDEGRARGNWFPSINVPSTQVELSSTDKSGSGALSRLDSVIASAKLGDTIWQTNNLPYILPLENGSSKQAPDGMVDVNLNAVAAQFGGVVDR